MTYIHEQVVLKNNSTEHVKTPVFFSFCFSRRDVGGSNAGPCFSGRETGDDARARHGPAPLPQVREDLSVRAHPAHPHGGQAHHLPGLPVRALRHGGQVAQLAPLTHVAPASRHINQGALLFGQTFSAACY
jgi:hypothetical protein